MSKLNELFKSVEQAFTLKKKVDFEELKISITLQTMTSKEELMALEACKDFEEGAFIEALKKSSLAYSIHQINDTHDPEKPEEFLFNDSNVTYEDDQGKTVKESKYLFLLHQIENWPAAVRDILFDAFNNLNVELEAIVNNKVKFQRFTVQQPSVVEEPKKDSGAPEGFHKIEKEEGSPEETDVDKLNKRVALEQAQAQVDLDKKRNG